MHTHKRGIILVASLMLILFASITIVSVTVFIIQKFSHADTKRINTSSLELAHAGIQQALYSYRSNNTSGTGYFSLGQINIDVDNYFVLGGTDADFLMVNTSNVALSGNGKNVQNIMLQNANNTRPVTITRMIVSWTHPNPNRRLTRIRIQRCQRWNGNLATPADADIADCTIGSRQGRPRTYRIRRLQFNRDMSAAVNIDVRFVMSDGSTRDVRVLPASNNFNFTVKATGKFTGANNYRTIHADYNAITSRVTDIREINTEILP